MSSTTNAVTAKLAERANACIQLEEHCKQLEEEAEQERLEEERLAKELQEMRVEEERKAEEKREAERQAEEWRKREEEEERATKVFTQKEVEALRKQLDKAKRKKVLKRSRAKLEEEEERTGESAMLDGQVVWRTKAGQICRECRKRERKCFWPEASSRTKACHLCSALKVKCLVPGEESSEARPSKKRKVAADKGKEKAKEVKETKSEPEFGFWELVEELRGLRQDLREFWTDLRSTHRITVQVLNHIGDIADSVEDMARYFVPYPEEKKEEAGNSGNAREAEDDEEETLQ